MDKQVRFSCTTFLGGKKGILVPDEYGYYTQPIGGLNVFNSAGSFYTYQRSKELFEQSSNFMRRVKTGCLKSEEGHPSPRPGESRESFANRVLAIDEKNVCAHISEVWLDFDNVKDSSGKSIIAIMGKIKPAGPYGGSLKQSYDNPKEDVCFSIRSFTEDKRVGGVTEKSLVEIVTFDHVVKFCHTMQ